MGLDCNNMDDNEELPDLIDYDEEVNKSMPSLLRLCLEVVCNEPRRFKSFRLPMDLREELQLLLYSRMKTELLRRTYNLRSHLRWNSKTTTNWKYRRANQNFERWPWLYTKNCWYFEENSGWTKFLALTSNKNK